MKTTAVLLKFDAKIEFFSGTCQFSGSFTSMPRPHEDTGKNENRVEFC